MRPGDALRQYREKDVKRRIGREHGTKPANVNQEDSTVSSADMIKRDLAENLLTCLYDKCSLINTKVVGKQGDVQVLDV